MNSTPESYDQPWPYFPLDCYNSAPQQIEPSPHTNGPYEATSRHMTTSLSSTAEGMRSEMKKPLQSSNLAQSFTSQSDSNQTTSRCASRTHDRVDFTDGLHLSLLDNSLDHDPTVLLDLQRTTGSQSTGLGWNLNTSELCYPLEYPSIVCGQANLKSPYETNTTQAASGPSNLPLRAPMQVITQYNSTELPTAQSSVSVVGTIQCNSDTDKFTFQCTDSGCLVPPFDRWFNLTRHYNSAHALNPTKFWCPVSGCDRGEYGSGNFFIRKDAMKQHAWNMHGVQ